MNSSVEEEIRKLDIEDYLSGIFILVSTLVIWGNQFQKKFILTEDMQYEAEAKDRYIIALLLAITIYFIFVRKTYITFEEAMRSNEDSTIDGVRFYGSVLILIGLICLLYYQTKSTVSDGGPAL